MWQPAALSTAVAPEPALPQAMDLSLPAAIPVFSGRCGSWRLSLARVPYTAEGLARVYDRAADGWAQGLRRLGVPQAYDRLLAGLALEAPGQPLRVLDCGVGTGALSLSVARQCAGPFTLDGVDLSCGMLDRADQALAAKGIQAHLRQADLQALPYADNAFDLVMAGHVVEHLADPRAALAEMRRVLRPGGTLLVCVTRRSLAGALIQLAWRTHGVTPTQAAAWLHGLALVDARVHPLPGPLCQYLSLACIGQKPTANTAATALQ